VKADLCQAFCNDITVTPVPVGLAVSTAFRRDDGDRVSFYVIDRGNDGDTVVIEDDGATLATLESAGVDFETETRRRALDTLLSSAGAYFDFDDCVIRTRPFERTEIATKALDFLSMMIRMGDFLLLTQEKVASTFREDAAELIRVAVAGKAQIRENASVNSRLSEIKADMVIETEKRPPVAVFFGSSTSRVYDAMMLQLTATLEVKQDLSVIALLEDDNSVPVDLRRRATNRLTTVPVFRQDEAAAVNRIVREALGNAA
jgi:hypothetical protein